MPQKKVIRNNKTEKKISEETSDILSVLEKPITKIVKTSKTRKQSSNTLYKKFSINKKESDRINFDEIYNKQKRSKESEVNFIPQEISTIPNQITKKILLLIVVSLSLLCLIFCLLGLFIYRNSFNKEIINLIENNKKLDEMYSKQKADIKNIKLINGDLTYISNMFSNHVYWSNFIDFLEKNIVKNVYAKDIFAESDGDLILSFKTNDYENISKQILVFQSFPNIVEKLSLSETNIIETNNSKYKINFKLLVKIDSKFLLKNE